VFVDGRLYDIPNDATWNLKGSLNLNFKPSVIAVAASSTTTTFGIMASDSAGDVTDASWKCTRVYYVDWVLPEFNDSSWPAVWVKTANGDRSSAINSGTPLADLSYRASWIWAADYHTTSNYAYCRITLPSTG